MKQNKVALVTGAGRGIGRAIALRLAKDGFDMVVNSRRNEHVSSVVKEIKASGEKAFGMPSDVASSRDVETMFGKVMQQFGRLDVLVTNAGITQVKTLDELDEQAWNEVVSVNAKGTYPTCHAPRFSMQYLVGRGYRGIVAVSLAAQHIVVHPQAGHKPI